MRQRMTVLDRAVTNDLTTVQMVRGELGLTTPDPDMDTRLSYLITQASSAISGYCGRVFGAERVEEVFWPDHTYFSYPYADTLILARPPIISVESLILDGNETDSSQYAVDVEKGMVFLVTDVMAHMCYF